MSHDTALRSLDAGADALTEPEHARAEALLERIVATPAVAPRRRAPRRLVLATAVAAAIAIVALALRGTDDSSVAYASWTAVPGAVAAHDLDAVVRACRDQLHDDAIPVSIAERRGDFVAVLFHRDDPDTAASCVARNEAGSSDVDQVRSGVGGSSGPAWTPAAGRISEGAISQYGQPPASFAEGAVGPGVVGVTIHAGTQTITATVKNGRYAGWWPGRAFPDEPPPPSGEGGPEPILTYDVQLADGSMKRDVAPARPD